MFKKLRDAIASFHRLGTSIASLGLIIMTGLVTVDVILRRLFNSPLIFADEVAGYLLVLVTFLGVSYTLKEDGHIQVKIIVDQLNPRKQLLLKMFWCTIGLFYTAILLYYTGQLTWESYSQSVFSTTPSQLPLFPAQIVMPIGCFLLLFQLIIEMIESVTALFSSKYLNSSTEKE